MSKPTFITREQERELAIRAKRGDRDAAGKLLAAHKGMFLRIARKFGPATVDRMQEVHYAALRCLRTYDPSLGMRFLTYATRPIRWHLRDCACRDRTIPVPRNVADMTPAQIDRRARVKRIRSLNTPYRLSGREMGANLPASQPSVVDLADQSIRLKRLRRAIQALPPRERAVIRGRMKGLTLDAVGVSIQSTKEWVRQLEKRSLAMLAEKMAAHQEEVAA